LNEEKNIRLNDYYGQYNYGTEEYYTNFRFDILNNGFKKYLHYFSLILNPKNIDYYFDTYIIDIIKEIYSNYLSKTNNIYNKERHLIE
jgi:hypothetical protein